MSKVAGDIWIIKYSSGYVENTKAIQKFYNEERKDKRGNLHRSSTGKPYRVGNNEYLNRIFASLCEDTKKDY